MLKIKDNTGKVIYTIDDQDTAPEISNDEKEEDNSESLEKEQGEDNNDSEIQK